MHVPVTHFTCDTRRQLNLWRRIGNLFAYRLFVVVARYYWHRRRAVSAQRHCHTNGAALPPMRRGTLYR